MFSDLTRDFDAVFDTLLDRAQKVRMVASVCEISLEEADERADIFVEQTGCTYEELYQLVLTDDDAAMTAMVDGVMPPTNPSEQ